MKKSGGWLINQGRTRSVSRSPWRIDPAKNSECEYDADDCNQRFGMQQLGRAEAIMHPAVGCGHVKQREDSRGKKASRIWWKQRRGRWRARRSQKRRRKPFHWSGRRQERQR